MDISRFQSKCCTLWQTCKITKKNRKMDMKWSTAADVTERKGEKMNAQAENQTERKSRALNYSRCKAQLPLTASHLPNTGWTRLERRRGGNRRWEGSTEADRGGIQGAPDQTSARSWGGEGGRDSGAGGGLWPRPQPEGQTPAGPARREAPPAAGLHGARPRALRDERQSRERGRESTVEQEEEQEEW